MSKELSKDSIQFLIARILENAKEAVEESNKDKKDLFNQGRRLAYYEMLDILKSELDIREQDLKEFGLDIDLDKEIV